MTIIPWQDRDPESQREEYEKQALAWEYRDTLKEWATIYTHMARALVDAFGEDEVLDTLEETWWNLQYEAGLTWRADFEKDPEGAFAAMYHDWHEGCQSLTSGAYDVKLEGNRWDLIMLYCYHKEVALETKERKIGISWCMSDLGAVRGWCPRVVMQFPNAQLRGDPLCYQIRELVDEANPSLDHWSREISEQCGWRSIKKLEE